jgi:hypothetical protein
MAQKQFQLVDPEEWGLTLVHTLPGVNVGVMCTLGGVS